MSREKTDKKILQKDNESCSADANEVREAMILNTLQDGGGSSGHDVVNPNLNQGGQVQGSHNLNVNEQTDVELGALADPGGLDPASDHQFLENMKDKIKKVENED